MSAIAIILGIAFIVVVWLAGYLTGRTDGYNKGLKDAQKDYKPLNY